MKIKKSLFLSFLKSLNGEKDNFELLKNEVLAILKKQAEKEKHDVMKAIADMEIKTSYITKSLNGNFIVKSGYPVGTIREWKGKKYIKVAPKMWKRKYDKNDRGASISAGKLIKLVEKCENPEQLMKLVLANKQRFSDENGIPLPIVDKIRAAVDKKNESFDKQTQAQSKKTPKKGEMSEKTLNARKEAYKEWTKEQLKNAINDRKQSLKTVDSTQKKKINDTIKVMESVLNDKTNKNDALYNLPNGEGEFIKKQDELAKKIKQATTKKEKDKLIKQYDKNVSDWRAKVEAKKETEAEKHANRSEGMKGNQNAKKNFVESLTDSHKDWIIQCIQETKQKKYKNEKEKILDFAKLVSYPAPKDKEVRESIDKLNNTLKNENAFKFIWETFENEKFSKLSKEDETKIKEKIKRNEEEIKNIHYDKGEGSIYTNRQLEQSKKLRENENEILKQKLKDGVSEEEITDENIAEKGKSKLTDFLDKNGITNYKLKFAKNKTEIWVYPKVAYDGTSSHGVLITADSLNEIDEEKDFYKEMIATSIMKPDERRKLLETSNSDSQSKKPTSTLSDVRKKYESSKSVQGNKKTVTLPNGEKIKCHYKLVEADAPTATHDEKTFAPVEALTKNGQTINDRDYSHDKDAQDSVINIASKYGGQALSNPPIVTKDGVVVSGNNRTMSSKLAAKNGTDKAYLDDLKEQIDEFGIDEDELKNFKHPRIILEMDNEHEGEYTTQEMAKFNESGMKTQNTVEKAVKISKTLGNSNISSISESISEYSTLGELYNDKKGVANFISKLIDNGVLTSQNKMEYVNSDNTLSDAGKEFVETVLVGTVLNENNIRSMNSEGGKKLRKKLIRALMPLAQNKGEGNEYSISNELNDAVKIALEVSHNPDKYKTVSDYTDSQDMFDENAHKTDEVTAKFADLILNHGEKEFADKMKSLQAGLHEGSSGQMDMFLGDCESKDDVMRRVLEVKKAVQKAIQNLMRFKMAV